MTTPAIQDLYEAAKEDDSEVEWNDENDGFIIHIENDNHWISIKEVEESIVYKAPLIERDSLSQLLEMVKQEQLNTSLSFSQSFTQKDNWVYLYGVHDIHADKSKNIERYEKMLATFRKELQEYHKVIQRMSRIMRPVLNATEQYAAAVAKLDRLQTDINKAVNVLASAEKTTSHALKSFEKSMRNALTFHRITTQRLSHVLIDKLLASLPETPTEELWEIIEAGLDFPQELDERMQSLIEYGKREELSLNQRTELDDLMDLYDKYVLLRAKTIAELQERGEDIQTYLQEYKPE